MTDAASDARRPVASIGSAVAVIAVAVLLVRITTDFPSAADSSVIGALVLAALSLGLLVVLVLALSSASCLTGLSAAIFVAEIATILVEQRAALLTGHHVYPSDEGRLGAKAIAALLQGHDPYALRWPGVASFAGSTPLYGGGGATCFGYPPFSAEVGAALGWIWRPLGTPGVVDGLGLLAAAVICFALFPRAWRALALTVLLGLVPFTTYAVNGHPIMLALPFVMVACLGWSRVGGGSPRGEAGRLTLIGRIQAACLGIAAATQQIVWFPAIGLVLCLWLVRRGRLGDRAALGLAARYAGVAAAAFAVVNLPFMITGLHAWAGGIVSVLTQHAVATGQGLVTLSVVLRGQCGNLDLYGYATVLMLLAALAWLVLGFRRVAPAAPVLLALVFVVGTRSQGEYLLVLVPVWFAWLVGTDPAELAASSPVGARTAHGAPSRRVRAALAVAALVPTLVCIALATASSGPLRLHVVSIAMQRGRISMLTIEIDNRTNHAVTPSFYLDPNSHIRSPWLVRTGPHAIAARSRVTLTLRPGVLGAERPTRDLRVWALSDSPPAFSSAPLPAG